MNDEDDNTDSVSLDGADVSFEPPAETQEVEMSAARPAELDRAAVSHDVASISADALAAPRERRLGTMSFDIDLLAELRDFVRGQALRVGASEDAARDLVLIANELATNSIRHGGGSGRISIFHGAGEISIDIHDRGYLEDRTMGQRKPEPLQVGGWGLWVVNQLADRVRILNNPDGSVIRVSVETNRTRNVSPPPPDPTRH